MNKQEFYNAFKKGVTCAITCLIIFFSAIFCFYAGYKLGRERVFDSDSNIVNTSNVQTQSIDLQPMDTVISSFSSSNFPFLVSVFNVSSWIGSTSNVITTRYIPFRFSFDSDYLSIYYYDDIYYENRNKSFSFSADDSWHNAYFSFDFFSSQYIFISYNCGSGFNFNVSSLKIGSVNGYRGNLNFVSSFVEFYDSNNISLRILFPFAPTYGGYNYGLWNSLTDRTYYFLSDISDNDYYNAGFDAGYSVGENNGIQSGYNNGYSAGDTVGYNRGYDAGLNAGSQYTFSSLLTAVVDAPVHVFIDLLNFDIMGYNLLNLVVGLLTFAIIVLILKLVLGGK